jgi:DNA primase
MSKYIQDLEIIISQLKPHLSEYLQEQGIDPSKPFLCFNPDHDDHNPSCVLIKDADNPRTYCHGCGAYYDLLDCVSILEKKPRVGLEWVHDTLKYLCEKYKVELKVEELSEEQAYELDTYRAYRLAASLLQNSIDSEDERYDAVRKEVEKRTWNKEILVQEGIGTVLDYVEFRSKLKDAGFTAAFLDEIDLGRRDIFNSNNLIFPWRDEHGRAIGFTARNLLYETQKEEAEKENKKCSAAKYNNQRTTGLKCNIFQKGKRFYGIDQAVKATPPLYVFEGQADAITARRYGLVNCVALAGSSLSTDHVILLKDLKCNDIVLCLDSDETGQRKQAQILEEKLAGHQELRVRLIELPQGDDPDSFIRENGIAAFRKLTMWSAFEWRLNRFSESEDQIEVCKKMVPFIANEHSPIERESLAKILATRTGVSVKAINDELNVLVNAREYERSHDRKNLLDKLKYNLDRSPEDAETLIYTAQFGLQELSRKYDRDILSSESFVRAAEEQRSMEQQKSGQYEGFLLGDDLRDLQDALCGEWTKDVVMLFGGKENVGKSALLCKIGYELIRNNEDVVVIYHTIDDTREQLLPRFVCIAEGTRTLTQNMTRNPVYWMGLSGQYPRCLNIDARRNRGYERILKYAREGRLIIKDMNDGMSLAFIDNLIMYHQDKNPEKKVVFIFDNLHKSADFSHFKEERSRFKAISEGVKQIAGRRHIPFLSSVEYTKLGQGIKPTNHNIGETVQFCYDANFIAHVYSEVADIPDKYTVCHRDIDWREEQATLPRVEINIGKNKITDMKGSLYLDFWPASSDYRRVDGETVARDQEAMKQERRNKKEDGDAFGGAYDK